MTCGYNVSLDLILNKKCLDYQIPVSRLKGANWRYINKQQSEIVKLSRLATSIYVYVAVIVDVANFFLG